jgi:methylenetetrahydromethanopterin dehydrogenase
MIVKVGFLKLGNIGSAPILEFLLDERAEREDIDVRVVGSGAKMNVEQAISTAEKILEFKPHFVVATSPNATLPGPAKVREIMINAGMPTIVVSDSPAKKAIKQMEETGVGYIIVEADAMIGARREFLDPIEMAVFNADIIKVLAVTGVFNILCSEIDKVISAFKKGVTPILPRVIIDKEKALTASGLQNPYARAKCIAAYEMARKVADLTVEGCFTVKEWERYIQIVAGAHEMMRAAAKLAEEAREIEKGEDMVLRMPHRNDGALLSKRRLIEKPRPAEA